MINKKSVLSRKVLTTTGSLLLTGAASLHAQSEDITPEELEETTILANRTETSINKVGSSVTILDPEELKARGIFTLQDSLRFVPGLISESTAGQRGAISSLFIRGTSTDQTQLRVDGIRISGTNRGAGAFLGNSNTNGLSRIEILKGPQGAVFGGDAIGGVVAIQTAKGSKENQGSLSLEAGTFDTFKSTLTQQGSFDKLYYSLSLSYEETSNDLPNNDFDQLSYSLRLDYEVNEDLDVGLTLRSFNSGFEPPGPEDDNDSFLTTVFADFQATEIWKSKLTLGFYDEQLFLSSSFNTSSESSNHSLYWDNTIEWNESNTTVAGITYEEFDFSNNQGASQDDRQFGVYVNHSIDLTDALTLNGGARWEDFDTFGDQVTWRAALAYRIEATNTKLRASAGKGFRPPTIIETFGFFGSTTSDVDAEESLGWDIGIDQTFNNDQYKLSAAYFSNRITDAITGQFDPATFIFTSVNASGAETTRGVEFAASGSWFEDKLSADLSYTYLDNSLSGQPQHSGGLQINTQLTNKLNTGVNITYLDDRTFGATEVDSYINTNLYASYQVRENLTLHTRVENIFDENYELFSGFGQTIPARSTGFFAGLTYTW